MENLIVEVWPAQQWGYLLNVYVVLRSNPSDAVTLALSQYGQDTLIRPLKRGRP